MATYRVELKSNECIDGISVTNADNVKSASLILGNIVISTVRPKAGRLEFWDDFYLNCSEFPYSRIEVEITLYRDDRRSDVITKRALESMSYIDRYNKLFGTQLSTDNCYGVMFPINIPSQRKMYDKTLEELSKCDDLDEFDKFRLKFGDKYNNILIISEVVGLRYTL